MHMDCRPVPWSWRAPPCMPSMAALLGRHGEHGGDGSLPAWGLLQEQTDALEFLLAEAQRERQQLHAQQLQQREGSQPGQREGGVQRQLPKPQLALVGATPPNQALVERCVQQVHVHPDFRGTMFACRHYTLLCTPMFSMHRSLPAPERLLACGA